MVNFLLLRQVEACSFAFHSFLGPVRTNKCLENGAVSCESLKVLEWLKNSSPGTCVDILYSACLDHKRYAGTHVTSFIVLTGLFAREARHLCQEKGYEVLEVIDEFRKCSHICSELLKNYKKRYITSIDHAELCRLLTHRARYRERSEQSLNYSGAFIGADLARQVSETFLSHQAKHSSNRVNDDHDDDVPDHAPGDWQLGTVVVKSFQSCAGKVQCRVFDGAVLPIDEESHSLVLLASKVDVVMNLHPRFSGRFVLIEGDITLSRAKGVFSNAETFMPLIISVGNNGSEMDDGLSSFKLQLTEPATFEDSIARYLKSKHVALVIASGNIPFKLRHLCAQSFGILMLQNTSLKDIEALSRVFSCPVLPDISMLLPAAEVTGTCYGSLYNYISGTPAQIEIIEDGWNIYGEISYTSWSIDSKFVGIKAKNEPGRSRFGMNMGNEYTGVSLNQRPITVLISSRTVALTAEIEKHLWSNLYRQRNAYKAGCLFPGNGVIESYLAQALASTKSASDAIASRYLRLRFADALERYASILHGNADLCGTEPSQREVYDDVIGKTSALTRSVGVVEMLLRLI